MLSVALVNFCFSEYTLGLANGLAEYVNLTLIQPEDIFVRCQTLVSPKINVLTFNKYRIRDPRNIFSMMEMLKCINKASVDILHVQETNDFWYDLTLLLYSLPGLKQKLPPLITTIHDVFRHPGDRDLIIGAEYTRRVAYYRSKQLIVHSKHLQNILEQEFDISPSKVNVVPHGELGFFYKGLSNQERIEREPYTLLFFGRIWPYKGLNYLLNALPIIAKKLPKIKLIIAGRGENIDELLPSALGSEHFELINTFIPDEDVASLFQRSSAAVLPYIESSQSGVAVVAYALGTPTIASNIGGLSETIRHDEDGLLVTPKDVNALADSIINLLSDTELQERIRQSALKRCEEDLSWRTIAHQTVGIYKAVLER
ncbi:MAG: glycosyltransferase family 4 protein [Cyanobacteria bacterium P01_F01_bin.150]